VALHALTALTHRPQLLHHPRDRGEPAGKGLPRSHFLEQGSVTTGGSSAWHRVSEGDVYPPPHSWHPGLGTRSGTQETGAPTAKQPTSKVAKRRGPSGRLALHPPRCRGAPAPRVPPQQPCSNRGAWGSWGPCAPRQGKPGVLVLQPPACLQFTKGVRVCGKLNCKEILMLTELPGPILGSFHLSPFPSICFQRTLLGILPWCPCSALRVTDKSGKAVSGLGQPQQ